MVSQTLVIDDFLKLYRKKSPLLIDTRSEKEYEKAHIPGAVNIPILNNEHRHIVGTIYKEEGRQAAVMKGFELVGPLFKEKMEMALQLAEGREVFVYCWRGGMRSNILAWLLQMAGLRVTLLKGGYKTFRHWALEQIHRPYRLLILGGKTGSGKTEILSQLHKAGEQVIDLEGLAHHKGSAFGLLGMPPQPSQEHFENKLGLALNEINPLETLWLENESRLIGRIVLPPVLFEAMRISKVLEVEVDRLQREQRISNEYCIFPEDLLAEHTQRIVKRLGPQHLKTALGFLAEGDKESWMKIILDYYDKTYTHSNQQRDVTRIFPVVYDWQDPEVSLRKLLNLKKKVASV